MNHQLSDIQKEYAKLGEKFKRINIVNDQVSGWAKRVFNKFGALVDSSVIQRSADMDLSKVFEGMSTIVSEELKKLIVAGQDEERGIEYGDVFTDFATDDFISKNIRVRPISGVTHADETKDGRQSSVSKGQITEGNEDQEEHYNKYAMMELEDQRKAIKKHHRDALEEIKRKQALLAKEAEAKKNK